MTKKRSSEIFTLKMEIFPEIGPRKIFGPPNFGARSPPMGERRTEVTIIISGGEQLTSRSGGDGANGIRGVYENNSNTTTTTATKTTTPVMMISYRCWYQ